jgi:hypothetical protein
LLVFIAGVIQVEWLFTLASVASRTPVAQKAQYDWTSVLIALLIALGLVGGFFVVQMVNDWLHKTLTRPRDRNPAREPSNGSCDGGNGS